MCHWVISGTEKSQKIAFLFVAFINTNDGLQHEEPRKIPFLIILSDGCYTQFPVRILPPTSCMLAGVRLAVIGSDLHRGDETILNFATVC